VPIKTVGTYLVLKKCCTYLKKTTVKGQKIGKKFEWFIDFASLELFIKRIFLGKNFLDNWKAFASRIIVYLEFGANSKKLDTI